MSDIERDAARYRWIKAAPRLRIERMPDSHYWISTETGEKYSVTHTLSAFDTGFSGLPTLDELVDQAMEMYPIPKTDDPVLRARAALADKPAVPEGREPASVTERPTVMQLIELSDEIEAAGLGQIDFARAVLARWGNCKGSLDSSPTSSSPLPPNLKTMSELSPAAQEVMDAVHKIIPHTTIEDSLAIAAALRAAAVDPYEINLPLSKVVEWEKIKGTCASYYAAAKWGYEQALAHINTIATELENHD